MKAQQRSRITIIGTGCLGTSLGLALHAQQDENPRLEIVGHDREPGRARQAQQLGAFDRIHFNLDRALQGASLVILAVPLAALREALQDVGNLLEADAGVVLTDTAHLNAPVLEWAEALLPRGNHFVSGDPFLAPGVGGWEPLAGPQDARADLFEDAVYAITARPEAHPSAVRTVANLAQVVGAQPYLMEPVEHDLARVLVQAVPDMLATALFQATAQTPGWPELRRAAGRSFATATAAAAGDAESRLMQLALYREAVVAGVDAILARLHTLREALAQGDSDALEAALAKADSERATWLTMSRAREWEQPPVAQEQESVLSRTLRLLLGGGAQRGTE